MQTGATLAQSHRKLLDPPKPADAAVALPKSRRHVCWMVSDCSEGESRMVESQSSFRGLCADGIGEQGMLAKAARSQGAHLTKVLARQGQGFAKDSEAKVAGPFNAAAPKTDGLEPSEDALSEALLKRREETQKRREERAERKRLEAVRMQNELMALFEDCKQCGAVVTTSPSQDASTPPASPLRPHLLKSRKATILIRRNEDIVENVQNIDKAVPPGKLADVLSARGDCTRTLDLAPQYDCCFCL
jgi:hypothetical protein